MESVLENSSQEGTMSDDDDDVAIPRGMGGADAFRLI